jgi:site-specific recombinase XerD
MEAEMDAIFTDYLNLLEEAQRDESTLANNRVALRRLSGWLYERGLEAATLAHVEMRAYLQDLLNGYKRSTAEKQLTMIRAAYSYAHECGRIDKNPTAGLRKLLPREPDKAPETLTADELRALRDACVRPFDHLVFRLLLFTGMRRHEVWAVSMKKGEGAHWTWADVENEQFVVVGKGGKHRIIPMHPVLVDVLTPFAANPWHRVNDRMLHIGDASGHLFCASGGHMSVKTFDTHLRALFDRAGVETEGLSHTLRRTLTTNLTRQGVRPDVIDGIFGWSATTVRSRYYTGRSIEDARMAIQLAYQDDPILPEQDRYLMPRRKADRGQGADLDELLMALLDVPEFRALCGELGAAPQSGIPVPLRNGSSPNSGVSA